jgi:hypothetical protein
MVLPTEGRLDICQQLLRPREEVATNEARRSDSHFHNGKVQPHHKASVRREEESSVREAFQGRLQRNSVKGMYHKGTKNQFFVLNDLSKGDDDIDVDCSDADCHKTLTSALVIILSM